MTAPKWMLLALIAGEVLSMVALIGRPRRTLRPADAVVGLVLYGVAAWMVVIA